MFCLLCLKESSEGVRYLDVYSEEGLRLDISNVINKHFWLQTGRYTQYVCENCWNVVNDFHGLYRKVVVAHNQLLVKYMNNEITLSSDTKLQSDSNKCVKDESRELSGESTVFKFTSTHSDDSHDKGMEVSQVLEPQIDIHEESAECVTEKSSRRSQRKRKQLLPVKEEVQTIKCEPPFNLNENGQCSKTVERNVSENESSKSDLNESVFFDKTELQESVGMEFAVTNVLHCDICNHVSTSINGLKRHKYFNHVLEKKYQCSMCAKAFKRRQYLKEHMSVHTGVALYSCSICDTTFKAKSNLFHHLKRFHKAALKNGATKLFYSEINVKEI